MSDFRRVNFVQTDHGLEGAEVCPKLTAIGLVFKPNLSACIGCECFRGFLSPTPVTFKPNEVLPYAFKVEGVLCDFRPVDGDDISS